MNMIQILPEVTAATLVVLDIDYTLFRSKTNLGMPEWIHHLVGLEMNKGLDRMSALKKCYPIWLRAQSLIDLEFMDENIIKFIEQVEKQSAGLIGLTGRGPESAEVTFSQFEKLGLQLNNTEIANIPVTFEFESVLLEKGIIFAHEFNDKGIVFLDWFKKMRDQVASADKIDKVIFVDDAECNVLSMGLAVNKLKLTYQGYFYNIAQRFKEQFSPELAEKQAALLLQDIPDQELKLKLQQL